jgi:hypothetical protein
MFLFFMVCFIDFLLVFYKVWDVWVGYVCMYVCMCARRDYHHPFDCSVDWAF